MTEPAPPAPPKSDSAPAAERSAGGRTALVVASAGALVVLATLAGWLWWTARGPSRDGPVTLAGTPPADLRFVGSRACRECHPGEYAAHSGSGHARTLRRAGTIDIARKLDGRDVADPDYPDVRWNYRIEAEQLVAERKADSGTRRFLLDYALGSGQHAVTFVSLERQPSGPPTGLEHRLTYFARDDSLRVTPGQALSNHEQGLTDVGFRLSARVVLDCFECHGTRTVPSQGTGLVPETLIANISCERCHGPGRAHVEAARRPGTVSSALSLPLGSDRWTAEQQLAACGRCHRLPQMIAPETIRPGNVSLARFPSVGMSQSACYVRSEGALRCTTCHDPHSRVSRDTAGYEATCRSCHASERPERRAAVTAVACPVEQQSGCIACHMPLRDVGQGLSFTDHWIRNSDRSETGAPAPPQCP